MVRISVELPDEVAAELLEAAIEAESTREELVVSSIKHLLQDRREFKACIAEAEADIAAGRVIPHEDVFAELNRISRVAEARRREREAGG